MSDRRRYVEVLHKTPLGVPDADLDDEKTGVARPTGANLVDPDDPAFGDICRAAMELSAFGYDPNDPEVAARIIEVGRERHEESPAVLASRLAKEAAKERAVSMTPEAGVSVVYYMRIGDRVKIGWSTNLASRRAAINPEELMAVESGGRELENARHRQFGHLRTHGEWFRLEGHLVEHIAELREAC